MPILLDMLMPAVGDYYADEAGAVVASYGPAFAAAGLTLALRPWTEGPGDAPATLALFAWGYHTDPAHWQAMLADWPAGNRLINSPTLLRWNTTKTYLETLARAGVPIVPSLFCDADTGSITAAFDHFGVDALVVKPQVSAGSDRTVRVRRGDAISPLPAAIIQPFLPAVGDEGELSLFYIGGAFSHAARKVAAAGDFRIQPQFGGVITPIDPSAEATAIATQVLSLLPDAPCYARADLLRLPSGKLALIELEAIEPDLYPDIAPGVRERLAAAVAAAIAQ